MITGVHPYADKFPMLPDEELDELAESIAQNGLRQPIVLDSEGHILDGRNRYEACARAGIVPETVTYEGDDLAEYVIDCNTSRRHMSTGARAMATALVLEADGKRKDGRWAYGALNSGESPNSNWVRVLRDAGVVLDHMPELAPQVVAGDLALDNAYRQAQDHLAQIAANKSYEEQQAALQAERDKIKARKQQAMLAELRDAGETRFLDLINTGELTIDEAHTAWQKRTREEREAREAARLTRQTRLAAIMRALATLSEPDLTGYWDTEIRPHWDEAMGRAIREFDPAEIDRTIKNLTHIQKGI